MHAVSRKWSVSRPRPGPPPRREAAIPKRSSGARARSSPATKTAAARQPGGRPLVIVGVGASAGGLEAFSQLLGALPENTGMAFVLVQHLAPAHASQLTSLLSRATRMPVSEIQNRMPVRPDHVYVIPPNTDVTTAGGTLRLTSRKKPGFSLPIDSFFRSLADDRGARAIGVILSGTGSDGVVGLKAIKAAGGVTFAQDDASAKYTGMPRSAVAARCVDFVLPPHAIAKEMASLSRHPYVAPPPAAPPPRAVVSTDENGLSRILTLLRMTTGANFQDYKQTTIWRRIARRMVLHRIESVGEYVRYLEDHPEEATALREDVLITVTGFFRDPGAFDVLRRKVFPSLLKHRSSKETVRVWVPGCSTGEEAYSLAMGLLEFFGKTRDHPALQIFATDASGAAIATARTGRYPESIATDVSPERLRRFFTKPDGVYQVSKLLRGTVVFAEQNITSDPPFSRLDLISCRNLLIYFSPELQKRVVPLLHYALKPNGFLLLGASETVGPFTELFAMIDKKHRIYAKRPAPARLSIGTAMRTRSAGPPTVAPSASEGGDDGDAGLDLRKTADRLVLSRYAPPGVIVSRDLEVLQFRGHTGPYLEPPPGTASYQLLRMARQGLVVDLRAALDKAKKTGAPVRAEGLRVKDDGGLGTVNVEVLPLRPDGAGGAATPAFLVLFEQAAAPITVEMTPTSAHGRQRGRATGKAAERELAALRRDLAALRAEQEARREHLQSIIDEREATNEELRSATEEIESSNEELQSTNEELETAKEELESANEELTSVNDELHMRNRELGQLNNDLTNVLTSSSIPLVIVGRDLCVRRFSGATDSLLKLIPTDVGRPIGHVQLRIDMTGLERVLADVIDTLTPQEHEVRGDDGRRHLMRIRPYRTEDDRIDGAVIAFVDVDALKRAQEEIAWRRDYAEAIVETVRQPLLVLDAALRVVTANRAFHDMFQVAPPETAGRFLYDLGSGEWNIPKLRQLLEEILPESTTFQGFEVEHEFGAIGRRVLVLNASRLETPGQRLILLAIEDRTELASRERQQAFASEAKDNFLAVLSHELRTPLMAMLGWARLLRSGRLDEARAAQALEVIERNTKLQTRLIEDLLDVSRIIAGKLDLDPRPVEVAPVIQAAVESQRPVAEAKGLRLDVSVDQVSGHVLADPQRLQQVVGNLVSNAVKYTPSGGRIEVQGRRRGSRIEIQVRDTGVGIEPDLLPHLFERFRQADNAPARTHGGLGLGLAIARDLAERHQGTIRAESEGAGRGATFTVELPLMSGVAASPVESLSRPRPELSQFTRSALQGIRVLVVEDDPDARDLITTVLDQCGAEVTAVASASEALETLRRERPHLLVSDIGMVGDDGYALMRHVRALPPESGGRTRAIAVTAYARNEDRDRTLAAGYEVHLAKPIEPADLVDAVSRLTGSNRPTSAG
jgi:two-component system, chemotaxis family, CheB/CheR fusion protein